MRNPSARIFRGPVSLLLAAVVAGPVQAGERIGLVGVIDAGYLLGGARDGSWIEAALAGECVSPAVAFRTFTVRGPTGRAAVKAAVAPGEEPCPDTVRLDFASDDARSVPVLAVASPWDPAPRKPRVCDPSNEVYQTAAAQVLEAAGVAGPKVRVDQLLRVDLDGDGEDEVIVAANTFAPRGTDGEEPEAKPLPAHTAGGFHSLVFLRRLVGETVQTTVLVQEIVRPQPGREAMPVNHEVAAVLDLNGDGRLEIVTYGRYYEGEWFDVFEVEGLAARKVLTAGCGA